MKTWRKALRRLIKADTDAQAAKYPQVYRRLRPAELKVLVCTAWAEISAKLTSVPRSLSISDHGVPAGRASVWSATLRRVVVQ